MLTLAPAQRIDVLIDAAKARGLNEVTSQQPVSAARFTKDAAASGAPFLPLLSRGIRVLIQPRQR